VTGHDDVDGEDDEAYGLRVFLRHYCVHLAGPDTAAGLPAFPADAQAARGFNGDVAQHLQRWRRALDAGEPPPELARRVARKTLLAVAGLVSVHDGIWTTDRARGAERWAAVDPSLVGGLATLSAWCASTEQVHAEQIAVVLDTTVRPVVDAFADLVGLW
jgi:hypothetical protein